MCIGLVLNDFLIIFFQKEVSSIFNSNFSEKYESTSSKIEYDLYIFEKKIGSFTSILLEIIVSV